MAKIERSLLPELNVAGSTAQLPDRMTRVIESVAADLIAGRHVFVSGAAGTGKSVLVREVTQILERKTRKTVALTAPTGIAADNIGGQTMHKYFGFNCQTVNDPDYVKLPRHLRDKGALPSAFVVDEISMVRRDLFDLLARKVAVVNGGRQHGPGLTVPMLCVGDFMQLPPVVKGESDRRLLRERYPDAGSYAEWFAFESDRWAACEFSCYQLTDPLRQAGDVAYYHALNAVRMGGTDGVDGLRWIIDHMRRHEVRDAPSIESGNAKVDAINGREMWNDRLATGDAIAMPRVGPYKVRPRPSHAGPRLPWRHGINEETVFRIGSKVLICANNANEGYVNGNLGRVEEVRGNRVMVDIEGRDEAVSVEYATRSDQEMFELQELYDELVGCGVDDIETYRHEWRELKDRLGGPNMRLNGFAYEMALEPKARMDRAVGASVEAIDWMPLKLAYAFTAHKSQGQTMDYADVYPREFFSAGQLYVALSRCTGIEGLCIRGRIDLMRNYRVSPSARLFYQKTRWKRDDELIRVR